jgi:hypothetical protein
MRNMVFTMKTDSLQAAEWYLDFQVLACELLLDIELQKINQSFTINSHEKVRCNFECDQFCEVGLTSGSNFSSDILAFLPSSNWLWNCTGIICSESRHFPGA